MTRLTRNGRLTQTTNLEARRNHLWLYGKAFENFTAAANHAVSASSCNHELADDQLLRRQATPSRNANACWKLQGSNQYLIVRRGRAVRSQALLQSALEPTTFLPWGQIMSPAGRGYHG